MTVDDEKSIYVGGLSYDCSEDEIRRAFELFGAIEAVKIVNDRDFGGKCYGFVTFANPTSVIDAIHDMNGRKIGGRVVRVNEVKTRGGRPHFNRGPTRRDIERNSDWDRDRDRDRDRDHDHDRERHRDRNIGRSRDRDQELETERNIRRSRDRQALETNFERQRGRDRSTERFMDEGRDRENREQDWSRRQDRDLGRHLDLDSERDREVDTTNDLDRRENDKDKDQQLRNRTGSSFIDPGSRELSPNSSDDYQDQVKEQLELSVQKREELQQEISQIEGKLKEREKYISDVQKRSQILEDALDTAKKLNSHKRLQLTKAQKCIMQVNDYTKKLKSSEHELQSLVDVVMDVADNLEDSAVRDISVYMNGKA